MKKDMDSPDIACEKMKNEYIAKDFKKDLSRAREIRNLANRIYKKDGTSVFQNDYTLKRFWQSTVWYIKKAKRLKFLFYLFSVLAILLPTETTLLNSAITNSDIIPEDLQPYGGVLISVLSAVTAVVSALLSLFKFQNRWLQCRYTAESLQKELSMFISGAYDYSDDNFTESGVKQYVHPPFEPESVKAAQVEQDSAEAESDDSASTDSAQGGQQTAAEQPNAQQAKNEQRSSGEQGESEKPLKKSELAKMKEDYFLFKMEQIMANEQTQWYNLNKPSKNDN